MLERARETPPGARILDVGAGSCRYRPDFGQCHYFALDFAKYTGSEWVYGPIDVIAEILHLPLPDNCFDVILCTEVLEHVPEPIAAVREMARLLKPGGRILITAPLGSSIHQAPYHFYGGYTPLWYERFLVAAGFHDIRVQPNGGFFKYFGQESARLVMMLGANRRGKLERFMIRLTQLLAAVPFAVVIPVVCALLDRLDDEKTFAAGYFVSATKKLSAPFN